MAGIPEGDLSREPLDVLARLRAEMHAERDRVATGT
jgi:hypothetical protein